MQNVEREPYEASSKNKLADSRRLKSIVVCDNIMGNESCYMGDTFQDHMLDEEGERVSLGEKMNSFKMEKSVTLWRIV